MKKVPDYQRSIETRRDEINNAPIEHINHPEYGMLTQSSPKSRTFYGQWKGSGDRRYFYKSKNGKIYTTSMEGKKADMLYDQEQEE